MTHLETEILRLFNKQENFIRKEREGFGLEESDSAGVILEVMDGPYRLPFPYRTGCPYRSCMSGCELKEFPAAVIYVIVQ